MDNGQKNMEQELRIKIGQLQRGDFLMGSRTTVLVGPTAGVRTPAGKVDLRVEWPNGSQRWHTWGRNTMVTVRRPLPTQGHTARQVYGTPIPVRDVAGEWDRRDEEAPDA